MQEWVIEIQPDLRAMWRELNDEEYQKLLDTITVDAETGYDVAALFVVPPDVSYEDAFQALPYSKPDKDIFQVGFLGENRDYKVFGIAPLY